MNGVDTTEQVEDDGNNRLVVGAEEGAESLRVGCTMTNEVSTLHATKEIEIIGRSQNRFVNILNITFYKYYATLSPNPLSLFPSQSLSLSLLHTRVCSLYPYLSI